MIKIMTLMIGFGALLVLLLVLLIIVYWRQGTKYGRMERAYRELVTRQRMATESQQDDIS